jgi:hypothetical protein
MRILAPTSLRLGALLHRFAIFAIALLAAAAGFASGPALASAPTFMSPPPAYVTGPTPSSVVIGDLNRDGWPDLVTSNAAFNVNTVSVLLGHGDGSFSAKSDFPTGKDPVAVDIGDLNEDGRLDLVTANRGLAGPWPVTVSVLLGNGNGTFGAPSDLAAGQGTGDLIGGVRIWDLNTDGHLDLVVTNFASNTVSVLLGNGDGTFGASAEYPAGNLPASVAVGDVDEDGTPDLAVANLGNGSADVGCVSVLIGNGDGSYKPYTSYSTGNISGGLTYSVSIADLNNDVPLDIVATNFNASLSPSGSTVAVLFGDGYGEFGLPIDYDTGAAPRCVRTADFDGDGRLDLATANQNSKSLSIRPGMGVSDFDVRTDYAAGTAPLALALGDLNHDGWPDAVVANSGSNTVTIFLNSLGGLPTPTLLAPLASHVEPDRADLSWYGATLAGRGATVYRQSPGTSWARVGSIAADGTGKFFFSDLSVRPGARYGYRLGISSGGVEEFYGETWIWVPNAWVLSLAPPVPNPVTSRLALVFSLPSGSPARLEVLDVTGRIVAARDAGALGAGRHTLTFSEASRWAPGVYLIRLTQSEHEAIARACIMR